MGGCTPKGGGKGGREGGREGGRGGGSPCAGCRGQWLSTDCWGSSGSTRGGVGGEGGREEGREGGEVNKGGQRGGVPDTDTEAEARRSEKNDDYSN